MYDLGRATTPTPGAAMPTITPFLMFTGNAEEAMEFYLSVFPEGRILNITRYGENEAGPAGKVMHATFSLCGQTLMCIDSLVSHAFHFTPSLSLHVQCDSEAEVDALHAKLSDGGQVLMPLDVYPFSPRYAWLNDRFGVSWQLMAAQPAS
jgi:predicted 3-demethylubiquinone-9 3-methyltransferase (glyoxalase superfamily)